MCGLWTVLHNCFCICYHSDKNNEEIQPLIIEKSRNGNTFLTKVVNHL